MTKRPFRRRRRQLHGELRLVHGSPAPLAAEDLLARRGPHGVLRSRSSTIAPLLVIRRSWTPIGVHTHILAAGGVSTPTRSREHHNVTDMVPNAAIGWLDATAGTLRQSLVTVCFEHERCASRGAAHTRVTFHVRREELRRHEGVAHQRQEPITPRNRFGHSC